MDPRALALGEGELGDAQALGGDARGEHVLQPLVMDRDDALHLAIRQLEHLLDLQHHVDLAAGREADRDVLRIAGLETLEISVAVDEIAREDPAIRAARLAVVADVDEHRAPGVGVERFVQVDAGNDVGDRLRR